MRMARSVVTAKTIEMNAYLCHETRFLGALYGRPLRLERALA